MNDVKIRKKTLGMHPKVIINQVYLVFHVLYSVVIRKISASLDLICFYLPSLPNFMVKIFLAIKHGFDTF
jgi:hypothetical protein